MAFAMYSRMNLPPDQGRLGDTHLRLPTTPLASTAGRSQHVHAGFHGQQAFKSSGDELRLVSTHCSKRSRCFALPWPDEPCSRECMESRRDRAPTSFCLICWGNDRFIVRAICTGSHRSREAR